MAAFSFFLLPFYRKSGKEKKITHKSVSQLQVWLSYSMPFFFSLFSTCEVVFLSLILIQVFMQLYVLLLLLYISIIILLLNNVIKNDCKIFCCINILYLTYIYIFGNILILPFWWTVPSVSILNKTAWVTLCIRLYFL